MANFIAIDLDSQGLYAVAGTAARGGAKVTHALAWNGDAPPPPLTPDTAKAIGEQLRDRLKAAGIAPAPVLVAVGRDRIILKELKYPPVPPTDEPALVRFQALKEMSESPDDIVLDYAPLGETAEEKRSMAVVVRKDLFAAIQAMCAAANLKLAGVTPRPYAIAAGLVKAFASGATPPPASRDEAVAALTLSPGGGEFAIVRRGEVTFTLALPAPVVASETMLVAQVRRNLAVYAGQNPGHPIQAVYVAEVDGEWAPRLGAALGVPVHAFDPLSGALPAVPAPTRGRFAGAVGLLAGRAADSLPINFAFPRQPVVEKDPAKRKLLLAAVAALLFLGACGATGVWFVGAMESNVAEAVAKRDKLKDDLARGGPDATRLKAIDGWSKREVVWLDELHDLADRMPADDSVRVTSFVATPTPVGKDGKQDSQARLELKIGVTNSGAANALVSAFEKDNVGANRFYFGTIGHPLGQGTNPTTKHNQLFSVVTRVNHREPTQYDRLPKFVAPKRGFGSSLTSTAAPAPVEPPADATAEAAPAPRTTKTDPAPVTDDEPQQ